MQRSFSMKQNITGFITKAILSLSALSSIAVESPQDIISSQNYISKFDLKWERAPKFWDESAFVGNGRLGMTVRQDVTGGVRFELGDTTLFDNKSRIPIGRFILRPQGKITHFKMFSIHLSNLFINLHFRFIFWPFE